jgi:hypothetical protein
MAYNKNKLGDEWDFYNVDLKISDVKYDLIGIASELRSLSKKYKSMPIDISLVDDAIDMIEELYQQENIFRVMLGDKD